MHSIKTPFHAYYASCILQSKANKNWIAKAYASSSAEIYPYQVAAASFALRSPYRKGAILCDEAGIGKSHEAMLVVLQKWLEGQERIVIVMPNVDLLCQWVGMIEKFYTVPYVVLVERTQWEAQGSTFLQEGIVITTVDFLCMHEEEAKEVSWSLMVCEEANVIASVYMAENKTGKAMKRIAGDAFKLLLTGTPIEKNIMDLYGLLWFIDETLLPTEKDFLKRYLRKPEHYPELSSSVSPYCFRTLRAQAKQFIKLPKRLLITQEYEPSKDEALLYQRLYDYIQQPNKKDFPEMNPYDLALRLLDLQSSSTASIRKTLTGVLARLQSMAGAEEESKQIADMLTIADRISIDTKAKHLQKALKLGFAHLQKSGANPKAVIFTQSVETQKMLYSLLLGRYRVSVYNGNSNYGSIDFFKKSGDILLSTDHGSKGFQLSECAFVIHYDLPYNTLKIEQRIDRCQRLGQDSDVISLTFLNQNNLSDVRKMELVNKRMRVVEGVLGMSEPVLGGFTQDIANAFETLAQNMRTTEEIESEYQARLEAFQEENAMSVSVAQNVLFTTFSPEIAKTVQVLPKEIRKQERQYQESLWQVVKWYFMRYNETNDDCVFVIDEATKTIHATQYETLPVLFYLWDGKRNRKYRSQKSYTMQKGSKNTISLASTIGKAILQEMACADGGTVLVAEAIEPCEMGLYTVLFETESTQEECVLLCGQTESGSLLTDAQCHKLMDMQAQSYEQEGHETAKWLKKQRTAHALDEKLSIDHIKQDLSIRLDPAKAEAIQRMKAETSRDKSNLTQAITAMEKEIVQLKQQQDAVTSDRMQRIRLQKQASVLAQTLMQKQETQFFAEMEMEQALQERMQAFLTDETIKTRVTRHFVISFRSESKEG